MTQDEEEPSRWMSAFTGMSALKAVFAGAIQILLSVKQWFLTLSAIGLIEEAQPGIAAGVGLYLIFTLATQLLVLLPILAFAVAPQKSADPLRKTHGWLQSHSRVVVVSRIACLWSVHLVSGYHWPACNPWYVTKRVIIVNFVEWRRTMQHRIRNKPFILIAMLAIGLLLAACGGAAADTSRTASRAHRGSYGSAHHGANRGADRGGRAD